MVRIIARRAASSSGVHAAKLFVLTVDAFAAAYPSSACCSGCSSPERSVSAISRVAAASARAIAEKGDRPARSPASPRK